MQGFQKSTETVQGVPAKRTFSFGRRPLADVSTNKVHLISLKDCFDGESSWVDAKDYFEADYQLCNFLDELEKPKSGLGIGDLMFPIWKSCEKGQWEWFVNAIESGFKSRYGTIFNAALTTFQKNATI